MNDIPQQKTLNIQLRDEFSFDNFFIGPNDAVIHGLKQWLAGKDSWLVYLHGHSGSGRTHLLQASCAQLSKEQHSAIYLPLLDLRQYSPDILQDLENLHAVCIDDIESIAGLADWEEALFYLYNKIQTQGGRLLVTSTLTPAELPLKLADLKSRLQAGITYKMQPLSDEDKRSTLKLRAKNRGFDLSDEVCSFIFAHAQRSLPMLMDVLDTLDKSSLASKRKITLPFVKQIMAW